MSDSTVSHLRRLSAVPDERQQVSSGVITAGCELDFARARLRRCIKERAEAEAAVEAARVHVQLLEMQERQK